LYQEGLDVKPYTIGVDTINRAGGCVNDARAETKTLSGSYAQITLPAGEGRHTVVWEGRSGLQKCGPNFRGPGGRRLGSGGRTTNAFGSRRFGGGFINKGMFGKFEIEIKRAAWVPFELCTAHGSRACGLLLLGGEE
jgi:hypothetical protein